MPLTDPVSKKAFKPLCEKLLIMEKIVTLWVTKINHTFFVTQLTENIYFFVPTTPTAALYAYANTQFPNHLKIVFTTRSVAQRMAVHEDGTFFFKYDDVHKMLDKRQVVRVFYER